jgi:hypothetical protein
MTDIRKVFDEAAKLSAIHSPIASLHNMPAYRARLDNWHQHAGVRKGIQTAYCDEAGTLPFSLVLVPLARHRLVCDRGDPVRNEVLGQHLHRFCTFTEHLELQAVVPACIRLRLGDVPFAVPHLLACDAGRVVIDESWHAECAGDLKTEMMQATCITPCRVRKPAFLHVLHIMKASLPEHLQVIADIVFTCVSETLITGSLSKVPHDPQVTSAIRKTLAEHAREEAFHHSIFGQVINVLWEQLSPADRDVAGPLFGVFIAAFLRPDMLAELDGLEAAGFTAAEARLIMEETYGGEASENRLWKAATPTVRFMRQHGLLEHAATRETMEMMDLVQQPSGGAAEEVLPH